ncbi:MAG TPA: hypothetical protein DD644_05010 [Halomonas sp.]|uniref:polysaccharide lyase n=1 Tax=Halomonadaceae TaxID=28256 RepID=UPI000E927694|nr:hypothetical protein [Halomonas sp. 3A7M]HBP41100.1 hypothetical protein [Halomonas sp.]
MQNNKNHLYNIIIGFSLILLIWLLWQKESETLSVVESFDNIPLTNIGQEIVDHQLTEIVHDLGVEGSQGVRVDYEGYERGSRGVVVSPLIEPAQQYAFSFWVRFCEGFDFARGGKLHGLGPANPVAGGNAITPQGWSARLMFRRDGGLQTYIYHQDMQGRFGDTYIANGFTFVPGQYHHVEMQVSLNEPATESNGRVTVSVDGERLIEHTGLRFRAETTEVSQIQRLLFSTFHGGSSPEWAPRNEDGSYKTDCAYFDTIELSPSL